MSDPLPPWRWWALAGAYVVLALAAWVAAGRLLVLDGHPAWNPVDGLVLAWLTYAGARGALVAYPAALAGSLLATPAALADPVPVLAAAAVTTTVYLGAALGLRRLGLPHMSMRTIPWFVLVGIAAAPLASAAAAVAIGGGLTGSETLLRSWAANAIGVATLTPAVLVGLREPFWPRHVPVRRRVEAAAQLAAVVAVPLAVVAVGSLEDLPLLPVAFLALVWVGLRRPLPAAGALTALHHASLVLAGAARPLAGPALTQAQVVMLVASLVVLVVATSVRARLAAVSRDDSSERRLRHLADNAPALIARFDERGEVLLRNFPAGLPHAERVLDSLRSQPKVGARQGGNLSWSIGKTEDRRWFDTRLVEENHRGGRESLLAVTVETTGSRVAEQALAFARAHDVATGLPTRGGAAEQLTRILDRHPGDRMVLTVAVDLDHFPDLVRALGAASADQVVATVAERMAAALPHAQTLARVGPDRLLTVLQVPDRGAVPAVVERVLDTVRETVRQGGRDLVLSATAGAVVSRGRRAGGGAIAEMVIEDALAAAAAAKDLGPNRWLELDERLRNEGDQRSQLLAELPGALDRDVLGAAYQPEIDLASGRVVGMEALVRWPRPDGPVPAGLLIGLARSAGLLPDVDLAVLRRAARDRTVWERHAPELMVSVNLSGQLLDDPGLADTVRAICEEVGLPPFRLRLEVGEAAVVANPGQAATTLKRLRAVGARIALDDFGTGCAPLELLRDLPFDVLKLDRLYVGRLPGTEEDRALVRLVADVAAHLGASVTAVGVETEAQRRSLVDLGCRTGQGYLLGRPAPANAVARLLRAGGRIAV